MGGIFRGVFLFFKGWSWEVSAFCRPFLSWERQKEDFWCCCRDQSLQVVHRFALRVTLPNKTQLNLAVKKLKGDFLGRIKDFGVEFGHTWSRAGGLEVSRGFPGKTSCWCHFPAQIFPEEIEIFWDLIKHSSEEEELSQEIAARHWVELRKRKKEVILFSLIVLILSRSGCSSFPYFGIDSRGGKAGRQWKKWPKMGVKCGILGAFPSLSPDKGGVNHQMSLWGI